MDQFPIDDSAMANLMGTSLEEAQRLIEETQAYMERVADEVLSSQPELRKKFEAEFEQINQTSEGTASSAQERERFVRSQAAQHGVLKRAMQSRKKIKASVVAEAFGGELPAGWDDNLPPENVDHNIKDA